MKKRLPKTKKPHTLEYFIVNLFIFAGIGLLSFLVFNVSLFNQFTLAFKDFTLSDIYYTQIRNESKMYDGNIVLINVENRKRDEIAFLLQRLEEGQPKVIGFDVIFKNKIDSLPHADELLKQTFARYKNIVYPYVASFNNSVQETRNDPYFGVTSNSFVNIIGDDKRFNTTRYFYPVYNKIPSFTTAVLQMYDPEKAAKLLKRGQQKTEIRFYGNQQNFHYQNFDEVINPSFNINILKNKIVLLGYLGKADGTSTALDEDRFFTPLNPRLSGRSYPDMYGLVINANILRMELDEDYIYSFPPWLNLVLAFLLCWCLLPLFIYWYVHKPLWYHLMSVVMQFSVSILFVFLTIFLYAWTNIKIEPGNLLVAVVFVGDFLMFYHHIIKYLKHKRNINIHSKFFESAH